MTRRLRLMLSGSNLSPEGADHNPQIFHQGWKGWRRLSVKSLFFSIVNQQILECWDIFQSLNGNRRIVLSSAVLRHSVRPCGKVLVVSHVAHLYSVGSVVLEHKPVPVIYCTQNMYASIIVSFVNCLYQCRYLEQPFRQKN